MLTQLFQTLLFALSATPPNVEIKPCPHVEVNQFETSTCEIELHNTNFTSISIERIVPLNAGDTAQLTQSTEIGVGNTIKTSLDVRWDNALGQRSHLFDVVLADGTHQLVNVTAFVNSILDQPRPSLDFGVVDAGKRSDSRTVAVTSSEEPGLRITKILEVPAFVTASVDAKKNSISTRVEANAPWGLQIGFIKLETNSPTQRQVWIDVRADVHGSVIPASNPFDLGLMRVGTQHEYLLRLDQTEKKPLRIGSVSLDGIKGEAKVEPCAAEDQACRVVRLQIGDDQLGSLKGRLMVELPDYGRTLPVVLWGLMIAPTTQVHTLDAAPAGNVPPTEGARSSVVGQPNLKDVLQKATHTNVPAAEPEGHGPLLKWQVNNEAGVYGYAIYRADAELGPFKRVNRDAVRTMSEDGSGASYQWRDASAESGKTYWYRIAIVFGDGRKQNLTGAQKVVAK